MLKTWSLCSATLLKKRTPVITFSSNSAIPQHLHFSRSARPRLFSNYTVASAIFKPKASVRHQLFSIPKRSVSIESSVVPIFSKFGKLVPTPQIPGLYLYEDFLTPEEHDSFVRALRTARPRSVPVNDERVGKFIRYIEPFEQAWDIMEKIGDSGLLGEETEIDPQGDEGPEEDDKAALKEIQQLSGKAGSAEISPQELKALKKKPIDPEEGEDDPIYLNDLTDKNGKPLVPDANDPESFDGLPSLGNSFYIQEYQPDGYLAPTVYIPGGGETEVIVSLYSPVVMTFQDTRNGATHEILIKPRSVYVVKDEALLHFSRAFSPGPMHTYKGKQVPRGTRYILKFCFEVDTEALKRAQEAAEEAEKTNAKEQPAVLPPKK